jgi:hypothetical protein
MKSVVKSFLMTVLFALLLLPIDVAAQMPTGAVPQRRLIRFGFGGGLSVPTSHAADALDNGVNGQAYLLIDTGILPAFRFNIGYLKFDFKDAILGGATGQSSILSGVGGMSMDLLRLGPVRPYVTAGLGAFHITDDVDDIGGVAGGGSTSATKFGIDGGAGLALRIGRLEAFIEGRVQNVYTDAGVVDGKSIRSVPVTFGILF